MFFHELLMPKNNSNLFSSDHTQFTSKNAYFQLFESIQSLCCHDRSGTHGRLERSGDDLEDNINEVR